MKRNEKRIFARKARISASVVTAVSLLTMVASAQEIQ
jgi:hypothetical protein